MINREKYIIALAKPCKRVAHLRYVEVDKQVMAAETDYFTSSDCTYHVVKLLLVCL